MEVRLWKRWIGASVVVALWCAGAQSATAQGHFPPMYGDQVATGGTTEVEALYDRMDRYERELQELRSQQYQQHPSRDDGLDDRVRALEANWNDSLAQDGEEEEEPAIRKIDILTKPTFKVNGRLFFDHIMYDDADPLLGVNRLNETGFDTARIGANGQVYENVKYKLEVEFEGNETDFKDVYIQFENLPYLGHFRIGHFKEPFSLEELTSSRFLTFMERSQPYQAFVPQRNFGFMAYDYINGCEDASWFLGTFRGDSPDDPNNRGTMTQDQGDWVFTGRAAWLPYYDEPSGGRYLVHVGGAYSYRTTGNANLLFRGRPELGTQNPYITSQTNNDRNWSLVGLEGAVVWGPASLQTEYYGVDTGANVLSGGYVQAGYFLTGEHRGYKRSSKAFDRVKPIENAFWINTAEGRARGLGAWELAMRWSYLDLNAGDAGLRGYQDNIGLGVNWYLNPYTRFMFDYIHEDINRVGGLVGSAENFGMRFQIDY